MSSCERLGSYDAIGSRPCDRMSSCKEALMLVPRSCSTLPCRPEKKRNITIIQNYRMAQKDIVIYDNSGRSKGDFLHQVINVTKSRKCETCCQVVPPCLPCVPPKPPCKSPCLSCVPSKPTCNKPPPMICCCLKKERSCESCSAASSKVHEKALNSRLQDCASSLALLRKSLTTKSKISKGKERKIDLKETLKVLSILKCRLDTLTEKKNTQVNEISRMEYAVKSFQENEIKLIGGGELGAKEGGVAETNRFKDQSSTKSLSSKSSQGFSDCIYELLEDDVPSKKPKTSEQSSETVINIEKVRHEIIEKANSEELISLKTSESSIIKKIPTKNALTPCECKGKEVFTLFGNNISTPESWGTRSESFEQNHLYALEGNTCTHEPEHEISDDFVYTDKFAHEPVYELNAAKVYADKCIHEPEHDINDDNVCTNKCFCTNSEKSIFLLEKPMEQEEDEKYNYMYSDECICTQKLTYESLFNETYCKSSTTQPLIRSVSYRNVCIKDRKKTFQKGNKVCVTEVSKEMSHSTMKYSASDSSITQKELEIINSCIHPNDIK